MQPESFADPPFDAVAIDRGTDRARHRETDPPAARYFRIRPSQAKRGE